MLLRLTPVYQDAWNAGCGVRHNNHYILSISVPFPRVLRAAGLGSCCGQFKGLFKPFKTIKTGGFDSRCTARLCCSLSVI